MKKQFLVLFFVLGFFFFPQVVHAKSYNVEPTNIVARHNDDVIFNGKPYGWNLHGSAAFHSFDTGEVINRIYYTYDNGVKDLDWQNTNYDVSFKLFLPNVESAALNSFNGGKPVVFLNDNTCYVEYASTSSSSSTSWSHTFGVKCTNVSFNSPSFNVDVFTAAGSAPAFTISGWRYGISWSMDFSQVSSNKDLNGAIKENTEEIKKQTEETKKQTETIKDSNTSEASSSANGFFNDFKSDDFGLSDIITMPLTFINGLSSSQCYDLDLPLPFVNQNAKLPCMTSIYQEHFGPLLIIYQTITTGFIAYWVCVNIFRLVQNFKDPDNDQVEVLDL